MMLVVTHFWAVSFLGVVLRVPKRLEMARHSHQRHEMSLSSAGANARGHNRNMRSVERQIEAALLRVDHHRTHCERDGAQRWDCPAGLCQPLSQLEMRVSSRLYLYLERFAELDRRRLATFFGIYLP